MTSLTIHASCVAFGNKAVLIRGKPGSGKSDLVLQLIDGSGYGLGAKLLQAKLVASNPVIMSMPDRPANNADQESVTVLPTGLTQPKPVTTTRRRAIFLPEIDVTQCCLIVLRAA